MILFTSYSFITAILVSNLFFVFFVCLSKSDKILLHIPLRVFAVFGTALLVKFLFPVEFVHAKVISSFEIFPTIIRSMEKKLFTIGGFAVQVRWLLLAVWIAGIFCISWSRIHFYRQLIHRFGHLPSVCDERYLKILEEVKKENGYQFETTVIVDGNIQTILEYGYFRQIIFMPNAMYSQDELRYIFLHELEHFANKTNWVKLVVIILECVFWWNPLIYPFRNACSHLLEIYCDSCVSKKLDKREKIAYLGCLIQEMKRESSVLCRKKKYHFSSQFFWQSNLKQRFSVMMQYERNRKFEMGIYFMVFTLFFLSYGFVLQPAYRPQGLNLEYICNADYVIEYENDLYTLYIDDKPEMVFMSLEEINRLGLQYEEVNMDKDKQDNKQEANLKNAFNNFKQYCILTILADAYILFLSMREILGLGEDASASIAGITTVLLAITIYHFVKSAK